jgi:ABC-type Fe3+/spermidine/putrescine transport system ATPase subunit
MHGEMSMALALQGIDKIVGREVHLKEVHLDMPSGTRHVILGRTLAGKTSLLRVMAGLDRPTAGRIFEDGRDVTGVGVRKRSGFEDDATQLKPYHIVVVGVIGAVLFVLFLI